MSIGLAVLLVAALVIRTFLQFYFFVPTFRVPGTKVEKKELGKSLVTESRFNFSHIAHVVAGGVHWVTESIKARKVDYAQWELCIDFTIHNQNTFNITLVDIHADEYANVTQIVRPFSIITMRPELRLYQDNVLLAEGRSYEVARGKFLPVALVLSASRSLGEGAMFSAFGLFLDYQYIHNKRLHKKRIPSDCIYGFQDLGETFMINDDYRHTFENSTAAWRTKRHAKAALSALAQHLNRGGDLM